MTVEMTAKRTTTMTRKREVKMLGGRPMKKSW